MVLERGFEMIDKYNKLHFQQLLPKHHFAKDRTRGIMNYNMLRLVTVSD
jgi:hypothetical protein